MSESRPVKFNISNAHYAPLNRAAQTGAISYGTPVAVPGSRSVTLDPKDNGNVYYADGIEYYEDNQNRGYDADWALAYILDQMRKDILQEIEDDAGVLYEVQENDDPVEFAFGFQIDGNAFDARFWYYCCTASRPKLEGKTNEGSIEPNEDTLHLKMKGEQVKSGDKRHFVRAKLLSTSTGDAYDDWFDAVPLPGTFSST